VSSAHAVAPELKNILSSLFDFCKVYFTFGKLNFTNNEKSFSISVLVPVYWLGLHHCARAIGHAGQGAWDKQCTRSRAD